MKRPVSFLLLAAFVLSAGISAIAQTHTPSINNRERRQQKRIRHGVRSGSLTR